MRDARYWHGGRLALTWFAVSAGFVVLRWVLQWGVYVHVLQDQQLTRVSGYWSASFATALSVLIAVASLGVLVWLTSLWVLERRAHSERELAVMARHRPVLM